ncbi:hypothetical protein [Glaciecola sp. SC05]|uniref:hypothetical protein n=1 Tax=Glaciecola sp. SC05 TaxID=1987355 RepID=UPI003526FC13
MNLRRFILCSVVGMFALVSTATAQIAFTSNLFGDEEQPGNRLHDQIIIIYTGGDEAAIARAIDISLEDDNTILGGEAKQAVAFDVEHANAFYVEMTQSNSLIEVTKRLIEARPEMVVHTITLGVVLYPDYAQDIYDGASLTGVMENDDLLVAMLQAGADPSSFVDATATGNITAAGPVTATIAPLGAGIGAGGSGGGDTTASTN